MRRRGLVMKALVMYYSRTGNTRKIAEAIAEALRADAEVELEEIVDIKKRRGVFGFIGSGKDAVLKRTTTIEPIRADLSSYDLVVVGTPVWAGSVASPIRTFLSEHGNNVKQPAFFCTTGGTGIKKALRVMEELCGKAPAATLSFTEKGLKDAEDVATGVKAFVEKLTAREDAS